jgi:hypothetical protein
MNPVSRRGPDLYEQEAADDLIVYDSTTHEAHRLNAAAALVYHHSDGTATVGDLAETLHQELGVEASEDLVYLALDQLEDVGLMERQDQPVSLARRRLSRRQLMLLLGLGATATVIPVIETITAPPAAAFSSSIP